MILSVLTLFAGQAVAPPMPAKPVGAGDRVVCRQLSHTGSRIPPKRICRTAAEWAADERNSREDFERTKSRAAGGGTVGLGPTN